MSPDVASRSTCGGEDGLRYTFRDRQPSMMIGGSEPLKVSKISSTATAATTTAAAAAASKSVGEYSYCAVTAAED